MITNKKFIVAVISFFSVFLFFVSYDFSFATIDAEQLAFSEQRKFIGEEFDADTGLNYLNARYYDAKRGQFISQDVLVRDNPERFLTDPQQLNYYSYARNNPIVGSDPSGLLTAYFPGTWTSQSDITNSKGYSNFIDSVKSTFSQLGSGDNFWMPSRTLQDNKNSRASVANEFMDYLSNYKFTEGETFNLVGHSHGGNVANLISQLSDRKIDNLVTLGTPAREYEVNKSMVSKHYNAYSSLDAFQVMGGGMPITAVAGSVVGGIAGSLFGPFGPVGTVLGAATGAIVGAKLGWGETGPAFRKFSGAENINVTREASWLPWETHGSYLNSNVWSKIDKRIK